jgi:hypothetical protein
MVRVPRARARSSGRTYWLYGGDDAPWDDEGRMIPSDVSFGSGETGLVLASVEDPRLGGERLCRVYTPKGTGWIRESYIEVVR